MKLDPENAVLAVDGGGTNCRLALEAQGERHVVTLGSANVATDLAGATATIRDGLDRLAAMVSCDAESLCRVPAYLGLAGTVGEDDSKRVRRDLPLRHVRVEDDRRSAVCGALGAADAALAGLGTGSFFARQADGAIRLAGGWGARLGDRASGFWIGREALAATLDALDGLIAPTGLTAALLARFGASGKAIVAFSLSARPGEIAALAPLVTDAAAAGDPAGRRILGTGAAYVDDTLRRLGWRAGLPLCLLGGVSRAYHAYLPEDAVDAIVAPRGTALDGALELARRFRSELAG